jgi:hypothetical protein
VLINPVLGCLDPAFCQNAEKKAKKQKFFSQTPLQRLAESSIIGLTLRKGVRRPREAAGKIEGIGDVLSDGPRKFLEVNLNTNLISERDQDFKN